ncbi:MAG: hypothetical protein QOJ72_1609 [Nocardioidaceae bacterium]|nr:hypothetical protein [Nocardioidaceae bacterium]
MTTASSSPITRHGWDDLGGEASLLDLLGPPSPPIGLPASVDVSDLLGAGVGLAALSLEEVRRVRGDGLRLAPVVLDGNRIRTSAQCERHLKINGHAPSAWAPLSGFWRTKDGWIRTHGNYPHHAARLAHLLDVPSDASADVVAAAVADRHSLELEERAAESGAIVGAVRRAADWSAHPQAQVIAASPLIDVSQRDAPARQWRQGAYGPMAGVRVLDLTRVLAGPVATRNLAFAGADVLRIDSPRLPEIEWQHAETGPGKRSARLDLSSSPDADVMADLLATADVLVTGYRPESLAPYGLDFATLHDRYPGLVVANVSAWGIEGPWATRRGFDSIVQAVTGIAMRESLDGDVPGALPAQALDHSAGHLLTAAICRALVRQRTEGGSWLVSIALARIAHELLGTSRDTAEVGTGVDTVQIRSAPTGSIATAAPSFTWQGGPSEYPLPATPWGADQPSWAPTAP